jgi:phenylalanyl-tRNA synthetase alpha chain
MKDKIESINQSFLEDKSTLSFEDIRLKYLSKKGLVTSLFSEFKSLPKEEKKAIGQLVNQLKTEVENFIQGDGGNKKTKKDKSKIDLTLPGRKPSVKKLHPISLVMEDIKKFFKRYGFQIAEGPEVEDDFHNFEALNLPEDHPARDMQDTLYTKNGLLLRTHTSNVQIREMEKQKPPIRLIAPGRVYRRDTADATHSPFFHQVEGLVVDENISFGDLKGIIEEFAKFMFGKDVKVRFRTSFFPFTEPSFEYDFSCVFCGGSGCSVCKHIGWIEIAGAGMVDPNVFGFVNIDSEKYTGYAFGMGIERIAMLKYKVNDIRLFYENDQRFLKQF